MRRQTKPRRRPMRDRCPKPTPGRFWINGYPAGDGDNLYPVRRMLVWERGALSGDAAMIAAAHERAAALRADLSAPLTAFALLMALYLPRVELGGAVPVRHGKETNEPPALDCDTCRGTAEAAA